MGESFVNIHVHMKIEVVGYATYKAMIWILDANTGEVLMTEQSTVKGSDIYRRTMGKAKKAARYLYNPEKITSTIDFIDMTKEGKDIEETEAEVYGI